MQSSTGRAPAELRLLVGLSVCNLVLLVLSAGQFAGYALPFYYVRFQLDVRNEGNLVAWYSSVLLFMCAQAACVNGALRRGAATPAETSATGWFIVGCGLLGLSADEVIQFHEALGRVMQRAVGRKFIGPVHRELYAVIPPALLALYLGRSWVRALWRDRNRARWLWAGVLLWTLGIGLDSIHPGGVRADLVEEGLELFGSSFLLAGLIALARQRADRAGIQRLLDSVYPVRTDPRGDGGGRLQPHGKVSVPRRPPRAAAGERP